MSYKEHLARAQAICELANTQHRNLTESEKLEYEEEMRKCREQRDGVIYDGDNRRAAASGDAKWNQPMAAEQRWSDLPVAPLPENTNPADYSVSRLVRGKTIGEWRGAELEQRADTLITATDGLGGYAVPEAVSARVLDMIRAKSVASQAGVRTVPMDVQKLTMPKVITDPSVFWRAENAAITEGNPTLGAVVIEPKVVAAIVRVGIETLEDTNDPSWIERTMAGAIAAEIDRVVLNGSGSGAEPEGILYTSGINAQIVGTNGAQPTWADMSAGYHAVLEDNFTPTAAILHPRDLYTLDATLGATGDDFVKPSRALEGIKTLGTSALPTTKTVGTATGLCSSGIVGDFRQAIVGMRGNIRLESFRGEATALSQMQVVIRAYARVDVAILQPNAFCGITGMLATA